MFGGIPFSAFGGGGFGGGFGGMDGGDMDKEVTTILKFCKDVIVAPRASGVADHVMLDRWGGPACLCLLPSQCFFRPPITPYVPISYLLRVFVRWTPPAFTRRWELRRQRQTRTFGART